MKKTTFNPGKKIMASASMLLVSTMMLSSATYAWFTMNKTVTVSGMELNVKADSTYLIIGEETTAAALQANNAKAVTFTPVESLTVFPSAHNAVTNTTDASTIGNWYYKYADAPTASTATEGARNIASMTALESDYVLHKTVYITLAAGSETATNLRCTAANLTGANTSNAVTVLVTTPSGKDEEDKGANFTRTGATLAATVTDQDVIPVDIWIYYNGNDASVFTNNKANLAGATVDLEFQVDYAPAAGGSTGGSTGG